MRSGRRSAQMMMRVGVLLCGTFSAGMARSQTELAVTDEVSFERDWPPQATPWFRVVVRGDGSGTVTTARPGTSDGPAPIAIHVSTSTRDALFAVQPIVFGTKGCETGNKKQAQTGKKTLTVVRAGRTATCMFNYSDEKHMQEAVNDFNAIETTLEEGPKLVHLRRFDRLGLDAEIGSFADAVKSGRAIELENIGPVLRTLAGDGELMERVRNRASDLLAMAEAGK